MKYRYRLYLLFIGLLALPALAAGAVFAARVVIFGAVGTSGLGASALATVVALAVAAVIARYAVKRFFSFSGHVRVPADKPGDLANAELDQLKACREELATKTRELNNQTEERLAVETELARVKAAFDMANKTKKEFLANMSHEIRTPMNGVIGMSQLLLRTDLSDNQRHYAETISHSAQSFMSIINDIIVFSQLEEGRVSIARRPFNLRDVIEDVARMMTPPANAKNLDLVARYPLDAPRLFVGDQDHIRQIIVGLVDNAIKFTRQGSVFLNVEVLDAAGDDATVRVSVEDTGVGIPVEKQPSVFDMFTQADSSTTKMFRGIGLGLSIARNLVNMMRGRIGFVSEPGGGSTFFFTLTLPAQKTRTPAPPYPVTDFSSLRALVVDTGDKCRALISEYLERWEIAASETDNWKGALEELRRARDTHDPYQLIIIGALAPDFREAENLARHIKATPDFANMKILFIMPSLQIGEAEREQGILFDACVARPITADTLYETINALASAAKNDEKRARLAQKNSPWRFPDKTVPGPRVLLADDSELNRDVFINALADMGCFVDIAENGRVALEKLAYADYDLILMDCSMPEMDGYEATRHIRAMSAPKRDVPIVAITAHALNGDRDRCLNAGMNEYISKPFIAEEITRVLKSFLDKSVTPAAESSPPPPLPPPPPPPSSPPAAETFFPASCLDLAKALSQVGGKKRILHKVADKYIESTPEVLSELERVLALDDATETAKKAHRLKGDSAIVGGLRVHELALAIELAAKAGDLSRCRDTMASLKSALEELATALRAVNWESPD